jgi:RNase H-fold protein (predicted Holliday junction resolvase)
MKKIDPRVLQSLELQNEQTSLNINNEPLLALDWGEKYCGLAWTPDGVVCLPIGVFSRTQISNEIKKLAQEKTIKKLIVGIPISGDGSENHICEIIRTFIKKNISLPVEWCNERGSSQATISRDKTRIDDLAALHILERHLREQSLHS